MFSGEDLPEYKITFLYGSGVKQEGVGDFSPKHPMITVTFASDWVGVMSDLALGRQQRTILFFLMPYSIRILTLQGRWSIQKLAQAEVFTSPFTRGKMLKQVMSWIQSPVA